MSISLQDIACALGMTIAKVSGGIVGWGVGTAILPGYAAIAARRFVPGLLGTANTFYARILYSAVVEQAACQAAAVTSVLAPPICATLGMGGAVLLIDLGWISYQGVVYLVRRDPAPVEVDPNRYYVYTEQEADPLDPRRFVEVEHVVNVDDLEESAAGDHDDWVLLSPPLQRKKQLMINVQLVPLTEEQVRAAGIDSRQIISLETMDNSSGVKEVQVVSLLRDRKEAQVPLSPNSDAGFEEFDISDESVEFSKKGSPTYQ